MINLIIKNPDDDRAWCEFAAASLAGRRSCGVYSMTEADELRQWIVEDADALLAERRKRMPPPAAPEKPLRLCGTCTYWRQEGATSVYGYCLAVPVGRWVNRPPMTFGCIHWEAKP